jgi:hypothetical protein
MAELTAKTVKPPGPVLGMRRAMRTDGNPPGGGPSCTTGMSLTDCGGQAEETALHRGAEGVLLHDRSFDKGGGGMVVRGGQRRKSPKITERRAPSKGWQ